MDATESPNILKLCLVLCLVLSVVACKVKNQSEFYSTYLADYNVAKEKLTLNKDGTFVQEVTLKATSKIDIAKGKWSYNAETGYVTFYENFMIVLNGFRKLNPDYTHPKPGFVIIPAAKLFGNIELGTYERVLYKKIEG